MAFSSVSVASTDHTATRKRLDYSGTPKARMGLAYRELERLCFAGLDKRKSDFVVTHRCGAEAERRVVPAIALHDDAVRAFVEDGAVILPDCAHPGKRIRAAGQLEQR